MSKRSTSKSSRGSSTKSTKSLASASSSTPRSAASLPSLSPEANDSAKNSKLPIISSLLDKYESAANRQPSSTWRSESAPEPRQKLPSNTSVRQLLLDNAERVVLSLERMEAGRKESFYFLTVPGIMRVLEFFFALIHIGVFCFYCTHYEQVINIIIPPFFLANAKEQFFVLANYHTLMGGLGIMLAGSFSPKSNVSLISSLYPLVYDFLQCLTVTASSVSMLSFYGKNGTKIYKVMPIGATYKGVLGFTGVLLGILHFASIVCDWNVYFKRNEISEMEKEAKLRREVELSEND